MRKSVVVLGTLLGMATLGLSAPAHAAPVDGATAGLARGQASYKAAGGRVASSHAVTAAAGSCGVRVDWPHASYTTSAQIHTRAESFCTLLPMQSNSISGTTYRSRWYGWQNQGSASAGPKVTSSLRITVAINCTVGDWYRYRTEARGVAVIAGQARTAAAYEQNDSEIRCNA